MDTDPAGALQGFTTWCCNGWELGGGSVRIHQCGSATKKVFNALKIGGKYATEVWLPADALQ
jgi:aspartyl-tRNA synthetase